MLDDVRDLLVAEVRPDGQRQRLAAPLRLAAVRRRAVVHHRADALRAQVGQHGVALVVVDARRVLVPRMLGFGRRQRQHLGVVLVHQAERVRLRDVALALDVAVQVLQLQPKNIRVDAVEPEIKSAHDVTIRRTLVAVLANQLGLVRVELVAESADAALTDASEVLRRVQAPRRCEADAASALVAVGLRRILEQHDALVGALARDGVSVRRGAVQPHGHTRVALGSVLDDVAPTALDSPHRGHERLAGHGHHRPGLGARPHHELYRVGARRARDRVDAAADVRGPLLLECLNGFAAQVVAASRTCEQEGLGFVRYVTPLRRQINRGDLHLFRLRSAAHRPRVASLAVPLASA